MEQNEITVTVDVKMDLKERRSEFHKFRNWSRTMLRIEAIKCFPCYVKVTFIEPTPSPHMPLANSVININLPGLSVNLASSRTKPHTYGLFWKNNRNRCCVYLAFDTAELCARHHHWMQTSIRNLDLHRREILETRRASRCQTSSMSTTAATDDDRCNDTANIADLNDLLGPLPAVPDASSFGWSLRNSGVSGIYEEILERSSGEGSASARDASHNAARKLSRASVASGIYEVMRAPKHHPIISESTPLSPPPLPPRSRTFTNQEMEFKRSYTNPDADAFNKHRSGIAAILQSMQHRRQSMSKPCSPAVDTPTLTNDDAKAFSFSSPDLTKYLAAQNGAQIATGSIPSTPRHPTAEPAVLPTKPTNDFDALKLTQSMFNFGTSPAVKARTPQRGFIDQHTSRTTPSTPMAAMPSHMQQTPSSLNGSKVIECSSGYCAMAPIIAKTPAQGSKPVLQNAQSSDKYSYISKLPVPTNSDVRQRSVPDPTTLPFNIGASATQHTQASTDVIANAARTTTNSATDVVPMNAYKSPLRSTSNNHRCSTPQMPFHIATVVHRPQPFASEPRPQRVASSLNIDDKYPSYYPNASMTSPRQQNGNGTSRQSVPLQSPSKPKQKRTTPTLLRNRNHESRVVAGADASAKETINLKTSPPKTTVTTAAEAKPDDRNRPKHKILRRCRVKSKPTPGVADANDATSLNIVPAIGGAVEPFVDIVDENIVAADVARAVSSVEKPSSKVAELGTSIRRFASLPRFRKLNFSPLKLKINSVLQR